MNIPAFLVLNIFTLILTLTVLILSKQQDGSKTFKNKSFATMLLALAILIIADTMGRFDIDKTNTVSVVTVRIGNCFTFLIDPIFYIIMLNYVDSWMTKKVKNKVIWYNLMIVFVTINTILVPLSEFTKYNLLYYYDDNMIYHRGKLFLIRAIFVILSCLMVEIYILVHKNNIERNYRKVMIIFPIIPIALGILQALVIPTLALEYTGMFYSCMLLYILVQQKDANKDTLTGMYNRKKFDSVLKDKVREENSNFSLIMIDLDFFKEINDTYGHVKGDEALINMTQILSKNFRNKDIIARFGGDEFCVITDIDNVETLEKTIKRLKKSIKTFNRESNEPYELSASIGYKIYDNKSKISIEEFVNSVDELMYEEKKEKHKNR